MKIAFFLLFSLFQISVALADSTDTTKIVAFKLNATFDSTRSNIDTFLFEFQNYHPVVSKSFSSSYTGTNGLPVLTNIFQYQDNFQVAPFLNPFKYYMSKQSDIEFYNTKRPFTEIFYTVGINSSQNLKIFHTQNVNKNLNFGVKYIIASAEGPLKKQKARDHSFSAFSSYNSSRYSAYLNVIYNKFNTLANGGMTTDSLFEETEDPLETFQIKNTGGSLVLDNKTVNLTQNLNLIKKYSSDSVFKLNPKFISSLIHTINYSQYSLTYADIKSNENNLYKNWYLDSTKTKDSTFFKRLENTILYKFSDNIFNFIPLGFKIGATYELNKYGNYQFDTTYHNSLLIFNLFNESSQSFNVDFTTKFYLEGLQKNNINSSFSLKKFINTKADSCWLSVTGSLNKIKPDFYDLKYSSNHFAWDNNFKDKIETKFSLDFFNNKYKVKAGLSYSTFDNYIYYDSLALPKQADSSSLSVLSFFLNKNFRIWKLHLYNYIIFQKSNQDFVRIPDIILYNSLFFRFQFFKGKLPTHIGFDFFYNSYYYGYAYMPATNIFYQQNEKKLGGHPYVDFFISAQRKKARLFFKVEHLSSIFGKRNYYTTKNYPMDEINYRFGVSWRFND